LKEGEHLELLSAVQIEFSFSSRLSTWVLHLAMYGASRACITIDFWRLFWDLDMYEISSLVVWHMKISFAHTCYNIYPALATRAHTLYLSSISTRILFSIPDLKGLYVLE
jgi:hypothetical protein